MKREKDFFSIIKSIPGSWKFLIISILIYAPFVLLNKGLLVSSMLVFVKTLLKILPVLLMVFVLMIITNYFVTQKFITSRMKKKGLVKWLYMIFGGILSTGPIYLWYPLLADLKEKGLSYGLVACFLYNRAIKIPMIPIAIVYFGWQYVLVLTFVMLLASIFQGLLVDLFFKEKNQTTKS